MSVHLLVVQLRFTRNELMRCIEGVNEEDARKRFEPMNCISWIVGHLANQENRYWNQRAQGKQLFPDLNDLVGYGRPATTPSLREMVTTWEEITKNADLYLDALTPSLLQTHLETKGKPMADNIGSLLLRNIYHYWFHMGEAYAIRQLLGHKNLPDFVGDMADFQYFTENE
jgi:hypothetical protein